jgi:hypothetical protein
MLPDELKTFRRSIFHTQREFALLLGAVRGASITHKAIEHWEAGRRRIMLYQSDIAAIRDALRPHGNKCESCGKRAVVRKKQRDLCGDCATPVHGGRRPRYVSNVTDHTQLAAAIQPFLSRSANP